MLPFLNADEIELLTGYKKRQYQLRALSNMKVPHIINGRGAPLVHRTELYPEQKKDNNSAPNFEALA